ncbi:helix-turn-helix domain-containing protein [Priestia sp. YIM B13551]|uniref:AlbA family DNA-binding domain-containing protein n=1 Tax=Priestia sp. YIM B13551 TaxID=3366306 RepID=UPI00366C2F57
MNEPWNWTESDILKMIEDKVTETLGLDYKASGALSKDSKKVIELTKDVSAFANATGGVLVYGVPEDKQKRFPLQIDGGVDPKVISKEWLEQIINSNIQRRIPGVRINEIQLSHTTNVMYVIYVPESNLAPHMAADKRYYKRHNFQTLMMEDYEVRDVMTRHQRPKLIFDIDIENNESAGDRFNCRFLLSNDSLVPAQYTTVEMFIDLNLEPIQTSNLTRDKNYDIKVEDEMIKATRFYRHLTPGETSTPILNGFNYGVTDGPLVLMFPESQGTYYIKARIITAGAVPQELLFSLEYDGQKISKISKKDLNEVHNQ